MHKHLGTALFTLGLTALAAGASLAADVSRSDGHEMHRHKSSYSPLVEKVQRATRRYKNINVALGEGWIRGTPCVSGPNSGAMGVHFVLPSRIDGTVNAEEPESLMYEPMPGGGYRFVGVEYIIIASQWKELHPDGGTPSVDGHLTHYVGEPNRYGLPAFYELHVWAWEDNPNGNFADFNPEVTCDKEPTPAAD